MHSISIRIMLLLYKIKKHLITDNDAIVVYINDMDDKKY